MPPPFRAARRFAEAISHGNSEKMARSAPTCKNVGTTHPSLVMITTLPGDSTPRNVRSNSLRERRRETEGDRDESKR
jgi:hypothetical protein